MACWLDNGPGHADQPEDNAFVAFVRRYSKHRSPERPISPKLLDWWSSSGRSEALLVVFPRSSPGGAEPGAEPLRRQRQPRQHLVAEPRGGMGTAALGAELSVRVLLFVAFL